MDTNTSCIQFDSCDLAMNKNIQVSLCDHGKLLNICICLKNACLGKDLMVGVLICYNGKPYALETKEINTLDFSKCCCYCCCCCQLEDIYIDGFEFIFPPNMCKAEITVKVIVHYLL